MLKVAVVPGYPVKYADYLQVRSSELFISVLTIISDANLYGVAAGQIVDQILSLLCLNEHPDAIRYFYCASRKL
jgi:hypothetical protein